MKKIVSLLCAAAMLVGSLAFVGCQNGASANANNSGSVKAAGTGVVMGYVLDNRGEPVEGATVTLGGSSTTTNAGGEFVLTDVAVNTTNIGTATNPTQYTFSYAVTAKKDGYLSAVIPAIAVTYDQKADAGTAAWQTALGTLGGQYKDILLKYAEQAGLRSTTTTVLDNGTNSNNQAGTGTSNVGNDTANNTVVTVNDGSGKDDVMKILANALKDLENLTKDQNYFTQFYSTFGKAVLIPCDATLKGKVRLTTSTEKGSFISEDKIFVPTSKPTVRVSYTADNTAIAGETPKVAANDYTWKAEVDDKGFFTFEKLPSGVDLSITIDSFYETISDVEYVFSSASSKIIAENSGAEDNGATKKVKLGSGDANVETYSYLLYAQNDKLWITASNLGTNTDAKLIKTTDPITFTFNKPILKATIVSEGTGKALEEDIKTHGYTSELSEDKKTVTFKPVDGNWTGSGKIEVKAEAEDGATTVLNKTWTVALDEKTWVSLEGVNYGDNTGLISLSSPIVLKFTRPMTENVTFSLSSTNEYTRTWSEDKTVLTLNPSANAKYWKVSYDTTAKAGKLTISSLKAEAVDGTKTVAFWKNGAKDDGSELTVYFDTFVDVTLAKADVTGHEAFTITFSKALKSFNAKDASELVITENKDAGAKSLTLNKDYTVAIDEAKKVITVTSKEAQFPYEGKYKVTFLTTLTAEDGSNAFRIAGNKAKEDNIAFVTDFAFEGLTFKPVSIEVLDSLPATAQLSRAAISVTTDKVLKFTFNREVQKSEIKVDFGTGTEKIVKNYIDSADKKIVYIPLDGADKVNSAIVLGGEVTSVYATDDKAEFKTENLTKWFNNVVNSYYVYSALNLTGTSLIKGLDHVTGNPEYSKADPITAGGTVSFTFDADLSTGYKASYKIFGLKDVDNDTAPADIKVLVENGAATIAEKTVTVTDAAFKTKKTVGDIATYYVELRVDRVDAEGKVLARVFSSTNPYFGSVDNSFEKTANTKGVYNAPGTGAEGLNTNMNYGAFIVEVAEKNHLVATDLIKETKYSLTKSAYAKADALAAKSAIKFTFDSLPAGATASYELYDLNTAAAKVITSGTAAIADKVVTVQTDLLVSGNPKVDGKTFAVATANDTGISTYYLKLEVKDAAGNVFFSTANKGFTAAKATDFEKAVNSNICAKSNDATVTDLFKVEVAPLAVESLSWVKEDTDAFGTVKLDGDGKKTYKTAEQINPKAAVEITFNAKIPKDAKYTYKITDGSKTLEEIKTPIVVPAETATIKIQSDKFVAKSSVAQDYYIELSVLNGKDKIFDTASTYFGNASNFEKKNNTSVINASKDAFNVKVIKTQIVTEKVNDVESKTTKDTDKDFKKSYKSPIVLQFSHPVDGYTVKLYKATKLYTAKKDPYNGTASTDFTTYAKEAAGANEATKLADFVKDGAEYIFESAQTISEDKKVITVTPANFFDMNTKVNIAVFNEKGEYVAVKDNSNDSYNSAKVVTFTTSNTAADYAQKLADSVTTAVTVATSAASTNLKIKTAEAEIGNNAAVELTIPTECSTLSGEMPKYTVYVKPADGVYALSTAETEGKDTDGAAMSAANFNLGREAAKTTVLATAALGDSAFKYNGTVEGIVVKVLDGKHTVYKFSLADKKEAVLTITADNAVTLSAFVKNKTTGVYQADITSTFGADKTTSAAARKDFTLTVTGDEWLKSVTANVSETTATATLGENDKKKTEQKKAIKYLTGEKSATIAFTEAYWFIDDTITIKATDASGNVATYEIRIK